MTEMLGRDVELSWGNASIPGCRQKSASLNGEAVDISNDDSDGWRRLHTEPGEKQVDVDIAGVATDDTLKADWFNVDVQQELVLTYPSGATLTGTFQLINYKETGQYKEAVTFDAQFRSTGEVVYEAN